MTDIDGLAERYYSHDDPQFQDDEHFIEVNNRASKIIIKAIEDALCELTEEERESLRQDSDTITDFFNSYI